MNREQKTAAVAEIAEHIQESEAVLVVDYRGLTVTQAGELRGRLRDADAQLTVAKNTLTGRAIDEVGETAEPLREFLAGPTALTYVKGDVAAAAKAITTFAKDNGDLPAFKGGVMDGKGLNVDEIQAIAKLPSRDVLYGQLVGVVAAPLTGLARGLGGLLGGLAIALGQVQEKKQSGEIPSGDAPAPAADETPAADAATEDAPAAEAEEAPAAEAEAPAAADESGASEA
ncbi:50S ribosomal protein L10 [Patulibacter brassicae]|jgi:large subunit ribosomal protein L10|uniref:Large ribosomal subunit protein uL10 n=1 Tax=Patulibacter brassicae TaxID=1705717 RepID=A0ABU4VM11_9ACTN|nr:50S ribosomal protein L10 [Patulibacter brassicae]MDX8152877.1 50S ribosomal protein L10 [Patulibacter brassicae]